MTRATLRKGEGMSRIGKLLGSLAIALILVFSVPLRAQENVEPSHLNEDILDRVGASAAQIQEALLKDPRTLMEVKRWVAKDTADNGQVVTDSDLTDQAVGRNHVTLEDRAQLEAWYVRNWTLWLDCIVLAKTSKVVLFPENRHRATDDSALVSAALDPAAESTA